MGVLIASVLAGCSSSVASPSPQSSGQVTRCEWTTTADANRVVVVDVSVGTACRPLVTWVATVTHRSWMNTMVVTGLLAYAQLSRNGSTVRVFSVTLMPEPVAGELVGDFQANGWTLEVPP